MSNKLSFPNQNRAYAPGDRSTRPLTLQRIRRRQQGKGARYSDGTMMRGYVIAAYAPDDPNAPSSPERVGLADKFSSWLFDVEIMEGSSRGVLKRVPMLNTAFGITDMTQWVPRAATVDVKTDNTLLLESTSQQEAGAIHESDGDCVVVAFLDNDMLKPIIIGTLPHPETTRQISVQDDPQYKYQAIIRGNLIGIQDGGQVDIDITNQTTGTVEQGGTEEAASNPALVITAPEATITINDDGVKIELSAGKKTTIDAGSGQTVEGLLHGSAFEDLFPDPYLSEAIPILSAAGAMFGLTCPNLIAALVAFSVSGGTSTGASLTSAGIESD